MTERAKSIGVLGMHVRHETRAAFERAEARGDAGYAMAIVRYVDAGWETLWPYERMPEWLGSVWWTSARSVTQLRGDC